MLAAHSLSSLRVCTETGRQSCFAVQELGDVPDAMQTWEWHGILLAQKKQRLGSFTSSLGGASPVASAAPGLGDWPLAPDAGQAPAQVQQQGRAALPAWLQVFPPKVL